MSDGRFCPACYGQRVWCRFHKTRHCGCSWNDAFKCQADKLAAKEKRRSTPTRADGKS